MSFQLQQAAIAAELRRAGIDADAANRIAAILGNSSQQVRTGPQTQDLTPDAMRKITPQVRKYQLQNVDFLEGDPDYRRAQTQPSENKSMPTQASTVRSDSSPQQSQDSYRVSQGDFTSVRTDGDKVSIGLRVTKTGPFVTQDPATGSLIGRNFVAQSRPGDQGKIKLSIEEAGANTIWKLDVADDAFSVTEGDGGDDQQDQVTPVPAPPPECLEDANCPEGEICVDGTCTAPCEPLTCGESGDCGTSLRDGTPCVCIDGECNERECSSDADCPDGEICVDGVCVPRCQPSQCGADGDCAPGCICVGGSCRDAECGPNNPCPSGQVCINGRCFPDTDPPTGSCSSIFCGADGDCGPGCVCISGQCYSADAAFYCCYESPVTDPGSPPSSRCQIGPCFDGNGVASPDLTASGPYSDFSSCCASQCDCVYDCQGGSCVEDPQGLYLDSESCLAACTPTGELGTCCETLPPQTSLNPTDCIIRRQAGGGLVPRSGCPSIQRDENNVIVVSRTWTRGSIRCPITESGACCLPDGSCESLCRGDCNSRGGTFKGASWLDCETLRDPSSIQYDYPCADCNGLGDCGCAFDEKCTNIGNTPTAAGCRPCGDEAFTTVDFFQLKKDGIGAGDTVAIYVKSCSSDGKPVSDRSVDAKIGLGGAVSAIDTEGEFVAEQDGSLYLKMSAPGNEAIVCVTVTPAGDGPPAEVSCVQCCHEYSADFTSPPSCPDGWDLLLGDGDGDGVPDAPSLCTKCEELPEGDDGTGCVLDENSDLILAFVEHVNGSADKIDDITATDVLSSGATFPSENHFVCPDGNCYEGVTAAEDCPDQGGNPLP